MFEKTLEETVVSLYVTDKDVAAWGSHGCPLTHGPLRLTYPEGVALLAKMQALYPSLPKHLQKQCKATMGSLRTAFGYEFWERHP